MTDVATTIAEPYTIARIDQGAVAVRTLGPGDPIALHDRREPETAISWGTLHAAANQLDSDLARAYRRILNAAQTIASLDSPVVVEVEQDFTHVNWVVRVRAVWGGGHVQLWPGRSVFGADEGMSHPKRHLAVLEARDILAKLRERGRAIHSVVGLD